MIGEDVYVVEAENDEGQRTIICSAKSKERALTSDLIWSVRENNIWLPIRGIIYRHHAIADEGQNKCGKTLLLHREMRALVDMGEYLGTRTVFFI